MRVAMYVSWLFFLLTLSLACVSHVPRAEESQARQGVSQKRDPDAIHDDEITNRAIEAWDGRYVKAPSGSALRGEASWYGPGLNGNSTASGEIFDMYSQTAAHRKLPFGTIVRVENLDNGKSVFVRINDRGPYAKNRVIDVSYGAAYRLGMIRAGVARVKIDVVKPGDGKRRKKKK